MKTGPLKLPGCVRTGQCCTRIPIPVSPRQLRESYEEWAKSVKRGEREHHAIHMDGGSRHKEVYQAIYSDIDLVYPMLKDRCLGKIDMHAVGVHEHIEYEHVGKKKYHLETGVLYPRDELEDYEVEEKRSEEWRYVYGPCRFFERVEISSDGKRMLGGCSIYDIRPRMCSSYPDGGKTPMSNLNKGTFRGCGYNSPDIGAPIAEYTYNLLPLDEDEK